MENKISYAGYSSPLGWLVLSQSGAGLARIDFSPASFDQAYRIQKPALEKRFGALKLVKDDSPLEDALAWLDGYFKSPENSRPFEGKIDFGGTEFQQSVWRQLLKIPAGRVLTYGEVALAAGRPAAFRAVGQACGANPIPIIVPCHRVVASGGSLGGFGLGLPLKRKILEMEGCVRPDKRSKGNA